MSTPAVAPRRIRDIFSTEEMISQFVEFEIELTRALADCQIVPREDADTIISLASAAAIDKSALEAATERTGYPVAPFVRQLTAQCGAAGAWVHWGATTQDLLITTRARQVNEAMATVELDLRSLIDVVAEHSRSHRLTPMAGRGFGGHALPITFGLKAANWLTALYRHALRLAALRQRPIDGEFGGAMGTLASLGLRGLEVQELLLTRLGLNVPLTTASSARDSVTECVQALALVCASLAKIAQDVAQLTWTEIGELAEPPSGGKDTSSTLPHKANPVFSWQAMTAAARVQQCADGMLLAMRQEQERSGHGFAELRLVPEAFLEADRCLARVTHVLQGLTVHAERMAENLEATRGLITSEAVQMELGSVIGRLRAHDLVHDACVRSQNLKVPLLEVLESLPEVGASMTRETLATLLEPGRYLGAAGELVDRTLTAVAGLPPVRPSPIAPGRRQTS